MAKLKHYLIGRDSRCDFVLEDKSVSRHHAELTIGMDGRYYLTDCVSTGGTFVRRNGDWVQFKQDFIDPNEILRFGHYQISVAQLFNLVPKEKKSKEEISIVEIKNN